VESLEREDFFRILGAATRGPRIDRKTEEAYEALEKEIWRKDLESSPHGRKWHTSFHASTFPGHDQVCGRAALYNFMDIPPAGPISPRLRAFAEVGKAVEYQIVYRWAKAGMLLGGPYDNLKDGDDIKQLGFADPETWLTGSADAVMNLLPDWPAVLPVDIKSKNHDVVQSMKVGKVPYELKHYMQVQGYIYLCNKFHEEMGWDKLGLEPAKGAIIYYVSRQDPRFTREFYIDANWSFINSAVERMKQWRQMFVNDELPQRDPNWKWTEEPCKWCNYKRDSCKPDVKNGTVKISESRAVPFAKRIRPSYNLDEKIKDVEERWTQK
jgi:hypothetical protein